MLFKSENDGLERKLTTRDGSLGKKKKPRLPLAIQSQRKTALSKKSRPQLNFRGTNVEQRHLSRELSEKKGDLGPSVGLSPDIEAQAVSFVYSHYVMESTSDEQHGYFEYLPTLVAKGGANDLVLTGVTAIGLAGLANVLHSESVMAKARKAYGIALRRTNLALQSVSSAKNDETLVAILLLTKFEQITFETEGSPESWKKHVDGASMLLSIRGKEQVQTQLGHRLFNQITVNVLTSCLWHALPVPETVLELRAEVGRIKGTHNQMFKITGVMIDFINSYMPLRAREAPTAEVISTLVDLDQKVQAIFESMPPKWQYETFYTTAHPELAYKGYFHRYRDSWCARNWNILRMLRTVINLIIWRGILSAGEGSVPELYRPRFETAEATVIEMANDVCASMPQHAGHLHLLFTQGAERQKAIRSMGEPASGSELEKLFSMLKEFERPLMVTHDGDSLGALSAASCIQIIAPLRITGRMRFISQDMRAWIANRLRWIGETLGVQQAMVFADDVEQGRWYGEDTVRRTEEQKKNQLERQTTR
ncbi:MAG: hypothetical protein M1821_007277 [Bathelium mastoideum]|nr:MAG: hypothetical protein M1821_007277 [Bathelium mastoideum]